MVLSDVEIWAEIGTGLLKIEPLPSHDRVVASSIDLLLDKDLLILPDRNDPKIKGLTVDASAVNVMAFLESNSTKKDLSGHPYEMEPGELVIGKTFERIELPSHLAARVEGKSSLGRPGLAVHIMEISWARINDQGEFISRVPGSCVRGRGSGERETTASSLAGKEESSRKEDNSGQGKDGPAGAIAQGGNGR